MLGSWARLEPYQTASARPGPPALSHGKTLTIDGAELTWTGLVQLFQPEAAEAALTQVCRCEAGWVLGSAPTTQTRCRFRALSMERTEKSVSGLAGSPSATWISWVGSCAAVVLGLSRKVRLPLLSGVPMFSSIDQVPSPFGKPAASKTWPVTWSMAG